MLILSFLDLYSSGFLILLPVAIGNVLLIFVSFYFCFLNFHFLFLCQVSLDLKVRRRLSLCFFRNLNVFRSLILNKLFLIVIMSHQSNIKDILFIFGTLILNFDI